MASSIEIGDGSGGQGTSTLTLTLVRAGTNYGTDTSSLPVIKNSNSGMVQEFKDLSSGANTITLPPKSRAVVIVPPSGNTTSITYKGVTGDTGRRLHDTGENVFTFHSTVTDFVLTTGGAITGVAFYWI